MITEQDILATFTSDERVAADHLNDEGGRIEKMFPLIRDHHKHWVLDDDNICVPVGMGTYAIWSERERRKKYGRLRVARDEWWTWRVGTVEVSTVFLGLDHSFGGPARKLFETMVFFTHWRLPHWIERWLSFNVRSRLWLLRADQYQDRYSTYEQAKRGHARVVVLTRQYLNWEISRDTYLAGDPEPEDTGRRIRL